jgi:hypothetical protein
VQELPVEEVIRQLFGERRADHASALVEARASTLRS